VHIRHIFSGGKGRLFSSFPHASDSALAKAAGIPIIPCSVYTLVYKAHLPAAFAQIYQIFGS
jgi:hypothetical protein